MMPRRSSPAPTANGPRCIDTHTRIGVEALALIFLEIESITGD